MTTTATTYLAELSARIADLFDRQADAFEAAVAACVAAARADRLIYIFGTGHSHLMAEEGHYRAGGLACIVPVLAAPVMLHEGAIAGTRFERTAGVADIVLQRYPIAPGDVMIVVSNSGVNAMPVEAARIGRDRGATVIGITSEDYSRQAAAGRPRLAEIAQVVLDNGAPPGDAIMAVGDAGVKAGPVSTAIGAAILNAIFVETAARLAAFGDAPIYVSANMPGAAERNAALVEKYRPRNPHL